MFSTCSELTPRVPVRDGRMEQIMQPWYLRLLAIYARESPIRLQKQNLVKFARHHYIKVYVTSLQYASRSDQVFWVLDNEHALPITAGAVALITPSSHRALDICPLHLPLIWCLHSYALRCQSVQLWKQLIACFCKTQFHRMYQLLEAHNFQFEV